MFARGGARLARGRGVAARLPEPHQCQQGTTRFLPAPASRSVSASCCCRRRCCACQFTCAGCWCSHCWNSCTWLPAAVASISRFLPGLQLVQGRGLCCCRWQGWLATVHSRLRQAIVALIRRLLPWRQLIKAGVADTLALKPAAPPGAMRADAGVLQAVYVLAQAAIVALQGGGGAAASSSRGGTGVSYGQLAGGFAPCREHLHGQQ